MMMFFGCSDARLVDGSIEGQTRIRLSPSEFVGQVPCRRGVEGGLRSYVARLYIVDPAGQIIGADAGTAVVQTSPPAPCDQAVVFPALAFQWYGAEILGFDRDLTEAEGSSVEPLWRATCGFGAAASEGADPARFAPTPSLRGATVPLRGCTVFGEGIPAVGTGQLQVDVTGALGALRCGQEAGEVSFVEATLGGASTTALCGQPLVFDVAGPARYHTIALRGFEQSGDAGAGAPPPVADAGAPDPVVDAGQVGDGGADASADDAGSAVTPPPLPPPEALDAGGVDVELRGVPRWSTGCFGRSVPGVLSLAACEPFAPLP
jgi:hypothetical protein